jgi:hypothetical protein
MDMVRQDEHFERLVDDELRALDAQLHRVLAAPAAPAELVDEIEAACRLAEALRIDGPAGLTQRIERATRRRPVLARIGPAARWAIAAGILLAAAVVLRPTPPTAPAFDLVSFNHRVIQFAEDAERAGPAILGLEGQALALAIEIDHFALAVEEGLLGSGFEDALAQVEDDMLWLEVPSDVF